MSCNLKVTNLYFVNVISFVYRYYNNYDCRLSQADKSQEIKILLGGVFLDIRAHPSLNLLKSLFHFFKVRFLQYA